MPGEELGKGQAFLRSDFWAKTFQKPGCGQLDVWGWVGKQSDPRFGFAGD